MNVHSMGKYDDKIEERLFPEIDIKYVNAFNVALEKDGCCGNTRKYYMKTLRAVLNKAIKEKEASVSTYPFGNGGFEISKLEEETRKRYLLAEDLDLIKNSPQISLWNIHGGCFCFPITVLVSAMWIWLH